MRPGSSSRPSTGGGKNTEGCRSSRPRSSRTYKKENAQLRRAVADLTVEKQILKDIAEGNF